MPDATHGVLQAVPASHHDLLTARGTAVFTTIDRHGRPQSTAMWYLVEDGLLKLSTTADRQKYKNLRGNPACTFFVIDPADSHRTLEIRADAELIADPDSTDITRFAAQYGIRADQLASADRYTIVLHTRRTVVNPPSPS